MAKRKSKKTHKIEGAKPIPTGDEAPDPGYQLYQWRKAKERFERSCRHNYDDFHALAGQPNIHKQLYELADKGFKEAQKREEGQRWPLFDSDNKADVSKDLPQASCILLMFHDAFQENGGRADYENALITPEMRVEYSKAISELREQVFYYYLEGSEQEVNLFTICMIHIKQKLNRLPKQSETHPHLEISGRKSRDAKIAAIATHLQSNPNATSKQVGEAVGISDDSVRQIWGPIKKALQKSRAHKSAGYINKKNRLEAIDESASCIVCQIPLDSSFFCSICEKNITGECKTCHYTNTHPKQAVP